METIIIGVIALLLIGYLLVAMLHPEKFQSTPMHMHDWLQLALFIGFLARITKPIGTYLTKVLDPQGKTWLDPFIRPFDNIGVAMDTGTQAARESGKMVDLDSNLTKLIGIVEIGKKPLMTRCSLTTFGIANDAAK